MSDFPLTPISEAVPSDPASPPPPPFELSSPAAPTATAPTVFVPSSSSSSLSSLESSDDKEDEPSSNERSGTTGLEGQSQEQQKEAKDEGEKKHGENEAHTPTTLPAQVHPNGLVSASLSLDAAHPSSTSTAVELDLPLVPVSQQEEIVAHELELKVNNTQNTGSAVEEHTEPATEPTASEPRPSLLEVQAPTPVPPPPPTDGIFRSTPTSPQHRSPSPLPPPPPNAVASSSKLPPRQPCPARPLRGPFDDLLDGIDLDDDPFGIDEDVYAFSSAAPALATTSMDLDDDSVILPSSQADERPAALLLPADPDHQEQHQMSSPPSDFMSIGFTTGGNRKAAVKPVGEDALRRARELMERDEEEVGGLVQEETLSSKRRRLNAPAATSSRPGSPLGVVSTRLPPPAFALPAPPARVNGMQREDDQDPFSRPPSRTSSPALPPPTFEGFKTAGGKGFKPPSRAALLAAAKLLEADVDEIMSGETEEIFAERGGFASASSTPLSQQLSPPDARIDSPAPTTNGSRTPFSVVQGENGQRVDTPTRPSKGDKDRLSPAIITIRPLLPPPPPTMTIQPVRPFISNTNSFTPLRPAAFKAPLSLVRPVPTPFRPLAPPTPAANAVASSSTSTPHRVPNYPPRHSTPSIVPSSTPVLLRRVSIGLGMTPRTKGAGKRPAFSTPFKKGHEGGVGTLFSVKGKEREIIGSASARKAKVERNYTKVFDLTPPEGRVSMANTYLRPEFYSPEELRDMGIPEEIWKINADNAAFFSFCDRSGDLLTPSENLDHTVALAELTAAGCEGLTPAWVENHWKLILWKLACLVRSKPSLFEEEKFSWEEMLRQLKYRYEREHNQGHRSAIQRIQEQDSPPALSMVLCITSISWHQAPVPDIGARDAPPSGTMLASMELTDGWYRIKATSDVVLSKAAGRENAKLKVGCKIGLSGVRLDAKDAGTPVLKALDSSSLTLTGNTTSLLPWDTKLGFSSRPFIACLSSLSADGGLVPVMDIVVEKSFPLAYVDGYDAKPGEGANAPRPVQESRSEADEMKEVEKWERANNLERRRIHAEIEKKMDVFMTLTERVERAAERANSGNLHAADISEDLYWDLDDAEDKTAFLQNLDASVLPALASFMKQKYIEDGNNVAQQIEEEIVTRCPPRNVRSMRVLRIRDFKTSKPATRTAQLTFWDAADQGEEGGLVVGKRYVVTNLMPSQRGSWAMGGQSGEIYLSSRRDSKWRAMN